MVYSVTKQHRYKLIVGNVLYLSANDPTSFLIKAFVIPMRIQLKKTGRNAVMLSHHDGVKRC